MVQATDSIEIPELRVEVRRDDAAFGRAPVIHRGVRISIVALGILLLAVVLASPRAQAQAADPPPGGGAGEGPPLVATSVEALAEALRSAGVDVLVTDERAVQPWIPADGVRLIVGGAVVDVFLLANAKAVREATAVRKNGPPEVQPAANVAVWLNGTAFIILGDAPDHSGVHDAIAGLIGPPQFTTVAGLPPPSPPGALPATGSGGLAGEAEGEPIRVWGAVSVAFILLATVGYGAGMGWRRAGRSGGLRADR